MILVSVFIKVTWIVGMVGVIFYLWKDYNFHGVPTEYYLVFFIFALGWRIEALMETLRKRPR